MAEYDALDQVVNHILPKIITRVKELKDDALAARALAESAKGIAEAGVDTVRVEELIRSMTAEFMEEMNDRMTLLETKVAELAESAPKKVVRRRRKNAATTEDTQARPVHAVPVTGNDILHANYALAASRGNITEACMCEPSVSREAFEYIAGLTAEQILDIVAGSPVDDETIPYKYVQSNWADVK